MSDEGRHRASTRVGALDGLRGLVIVSVVLNHAGGVLWARGGLYDVPVLAGFLGGGAVTVFFVIGALIVTWNLLQDRVRGTFDPLRFYLRRLVRLGVQLVPLCLVLVLLHLLDDTWRSTDRQLVNNIAYTLTHTLNIFGESNLLAVRPEIGHLWYLSVQQQCYLLLPLVLILLARWPKVLSALLIVAAAGVYWYRQEVLDAHGWVQASSMTFTRADGLLLGVVVAVLLFGRGRHPYWRHGLWLGGLVLLGLKLLLPELPPLSYLGPWSVAFTVAAALVVAAVWQLETSTRTSRFLSLAPFQWLGRASLAIFIWHFPVISVVSRHTGSWDWLPRTLLAFVVLAVIVVVTERWIERPTRRLLATSPVFRLPRVRDVPTPAVQAVP